MKRWTGLAVLALALWAGATFGLAVLATEWRQDETNLDPLSEDISDLRTDVRDLASRPGALEAIQTEVASLQLSVDQVRGILRLPLLTETPTPTPTPSPTPQPLDLTAEPRVAAEFDGVRMTVESYESLGFQGRIEFVVENITTEPVTTQLPAPRVVDRQGFVCGTYGGSLYIESLLPGEKTRYDTGWGCRDDRPSTLTLGHLRYFLPYVPVPR